MNFPVEVIVDPIFFFILSFFLLIEENDDQTKRRFARNAYYRKRKGGKPEVLSAAIIAKLIIPEYGDDKKKKKEKRGARIRSSLSAHTRASNSKPARASETMAFPRDFIRFCHFPRERGPKGTGRAQRNNV